jgi:glyoxylase-like metal-dependent hydrolase (beta-lactamase superfamily II)
MRKDDFTRDIGSHPPPEATHGAGSNRTLPLTRRRFLAYAGALGASAWVAPRRPVTADGTLKSLLHEQLGPVQQIRAAALKEPIPVTTLRGNLSALIGNGGNVVALPGDDGVLLIDAGIVGPKVAAVVATITPTPIRHLINTHWHFDHTDANEWHHAHGAAIMAQEKTCAHMATTTRVDDWDFTFPPWPAGALPATVFADERDVRLNGSLVHLKHYPPAHTDCDISAHFTDVDVLHVGDTWWNGIYPFIDNSTGGSIDGTIRAAEQNIATATPSTILVPGHGPVGDREALMKWRDMLVAVRECVAALKKHGQPLSAVVAAKPTASFDAVYGGGIIDPAFFTRIVYERV